MRKLLRLLPLLLILFLFTSCIDCVQSVTYKDGKYQMYYKVTSEISSARLSSSVNILASTRPSFHVRYRAINPSLLVIKKIRRPLICGKVTMASCSAKRLITIILSY